MSYKTSLLDIPFGGAKGCIFIDPNEYTFEEQVKITRRFTVELWKRSMINAATDVMGPDEGTDERIMNIIRETYCNVISNNTINIDSVVTGKSVALGGVGVSKISAGWGIACAIRNLEHHLSHKAIAGSGLSSGRSKKSIIIHGWNLRTKQAASFLVKKDYKIVGIVDGQHGCFNAIGFDPDEIWDYRAKHGSLEGISKNLNNPAEILSQKCDIFLAGAGELSIGKEIAENIRCKLIVEGCNSPFTGEAFESLRKNEKVVLPDIIAYTGSLICSYLEWLKNLEHRNLTLLFKRFEANMRNNLLDMLSSSDIGTKKPSYKGPEEDDLILSTIDEMQDVAFKKVLNEASDHNIDLKSAALKIAIENIYNISYKH